MKYPKEYLDEIKVRVKVSTIVSKTISLKKRGKEFIGLSPFKNEKTPSFTVNDEKEFYHCFSTGEHGNVFDFLMKTQNLKFGEAVRTLANLAGMRPFMFTKKDEEREKKFNQYISLISKYSDICHLNLINNKNFKLQKYLENRKLSKELVKLFSLGYCENKTDIYEKLKNEYDENILKDSGLFYFDEKKKINIERFRNRLIFPIKDISGRTIAFGGRIYEDKKYLAKYINSPETDFFKKGSNLYNLHKVRKLTNNIDEVYLVEGYMDVIGLAKNQIENVVANLGTALTDKQINILYQFFDHIIICFDGDNSGYLAAVRAAESLIKELQPNKKISFLFLPEKEDPDTFVNKNGKEKFLKFSAENLISIFDFIYNHHKKNTDNNPTSLALFEKNLRRLANSIKDDYIKKYVLENFLEKISQLTPNLKKKKFVYKNSSKSLDITQKQFDKTKSLTLIEVKEFSVLCLILKNLKFFGKNLNLLKELKLFTNENSLILNRLISELEKNYMIQISEIDLDPQLIEKIFSFASIKYILEKNISDEKQISELFDEIRRDLKNYELEARITELEAKFSKDFSENTFEELKELKKLQKIN
tara:strand:- start:4184 stop:5953 length:1770 start_codon:yes stop_codon:yes gene_type:complete